MMNWGRVIWGRVQYRIEYQVDYRVDYRILGEFLSNKNDFLLESGEFFFLMGLSRIFI